MPIYFYAKRPNGFLDLAPDLLLADSLEELFISPEKFAGKLESDERVNVYYGVAQTDEHRRADPKDPKTGDTLHGAWAKAHWERMEVFFLDLDGISEADLHRVSEYQDVVAEIMGCDAGDMTVVASGHGFHFLFWLKTPITDPEYFRKNKIFYGGFLDRIISGCKARGLSVKKDPSVFEFNRVLRVPLTRNEKPGLPSVMCRVLQLNTKRHDIDLIALCGLPPVVEADQVEESEYKQKRYDVEGIQAECQVIAHSKANPTEVREPLGYAMLSVLGRLGTGHKLAREYYSSWTGSSSLMSSDPDRKIEQALEASGPVTCKKFSVLSDQCAGCKWTGKITSPILIISDDFIPTEEDGFWRESVKDGKISYKPAYDDMLKSYRKRLHYFLQPETDAIWHWGPTHYTKAFPAELRNWCELNTKPQLVREQRGEFIAKLQSNHLLSEKQFAKYLDRCQGLLNMKNGVLDTRTGQLLPHSPQYGFKGVINYDYAPGALCPIFDSFLHTIMRGNPELIASIWDMFGACLMSGYDEMDAAFWALYGSGSNGKTSLLSILVAMLGGTDNCIYLKPKHFKAEERFALSGLEGKLLCIIEEVNEAHMGEDILGVLKDLSDGGTLSVEGKGASHWQMKNTAKIIMTFNKAPLFQDISQGLQRRLIPNPFEVNFEEPQWADKKDAQIVDKMLPELPGILNRGLIALAELRKRGGKALKPEASRRELEQMMLNSDSVERWCREHLEVTNNRDDFVLSNEAYSSYKIWLGEDSGKTSQNTFSARVRRKTLTEIRCRDSKWRVAGKKETVIWGVRKILDGDSQF